MSEVLVGNPARGGEEVLRIENWHCRLRRESSSDGLVRGKGSRVMETFGRRRNENGWIISKYILVVDRSEMRAGPCQDIEANVCEAQPFRSIRALTTRFPGSWG